MNRMRFALLAAAVCLALISPLATPAHAWGGGNQYGCQYPCSYQYQYSNQYPYPYQYQYPNQYQYQYQYPYPYQNQYANQYPYQYQYRYANPYPYAYQHPNQYPPVIVVPSVPRVGSLNTGLGDFTRCQQYSLHQASCFVPNSANSPNLASIQSEPQIQIWGICAADTTMTLSKKYQCSKTGAGWFPL